MLTLRRLSPALLALTLLGGCRTDRIVDPALDRVDRSVDQAKVRVDDSVEKAMRQIDDRLTFAKSEVRELLQEAQEKYSKALQDTSETAQELRKEFQQAIQDLDDKVEARIDQIRASTLEVLREADAAAARRIDDVFERMNRLSMDVLKNVAEIVKPITDLAEKVNESSDDVKAALQQIVERVLRMMEEVQKLITEGKNVLLKMQGKDEQGNKTGTDWGVILGGLATLLTMILAKIRSSDHKKDGDRWHEEEIRKMIREEILLNKS